MVGLVIVSHSARLADGVVELAAQMAGPDVRLAAAAGVDDPADGLGTDATRVLRAIEDVWSEDGVLVLMDLGSAVLSAELAADLLGDERRGAVMLTEAPLVEGAVAAAVAAGTGEPLAAVAAAARDGLTGKAAQLADEPAGSTAGTPDGPAEEATAEPRAETGSDAREKLHVTLRNAHGLHARPAALLVRTAAGFDARVMIEDVSNGHGPVSARSLNAVATLGARRGDELILTVFGPQSSEAMAAVRRLADGGFGEADVAPSHAAPLAAASATSRAAQTSPSTALEPTALQPPPAGARLTGVPAANGVATGPARHLVKRVTALPDRPAGDPAAEWSALEGALHETATDILRARASVAARAGGADAAIFDAHLLFLEDDALVEPARGAILREHAPAGRAWAAAVAAAAADWDALDDPYQRARAADLRDVGDQVLAHLAPGAPGTVTGAGVIVAPDLAPADVAGLDTATVTGVALAYGGPTSHAAILARALGLPAVTGVGAEVLAVAEGTTLLVDGDAGTVTVNPLPDAITAAERRRDDLERAATAARALAASPAVTLDGVTVAVEANIAGPRDAAAALAAGADGVGLLRTEFLFSGAAAMPDEDEQAAAYEAVAAALDGRPVTIRTLDAGADKPLPYLGLAPEANPFLGVRGLRLGLARPEQLLCQLRAILRVATDHPVSVMFPMVATVAELRRAREILGEARSSLAAEGTPVPDRLRLGIMLEVPAAALLAEKLAPLVDFFSVGTNDLTQYTLAAERGNAGVAALADPLHPAVLRLVKHTAAAATAAGRAVAVCGEVAADRLAVPLLLGLGVRELSMNAGAVAAIKQAVRATDTRTAADLARDAVALESAAAVRDLLARVVAG